MKAAGYYKVVPLIAIIVCVSVFVLSLMEMKRVNKLSDSPIEQVEAKVCRTSLFPWADSCSSKMSESNPSAYFSNSEILTSAYDSILCEWLNAKTEWNLLYSGTRDGLTPEAFHTIVDDKGECLLVIEDEKGNIFGAYTSVGFSTRGGNGMVYRDDRHFLFTLKNPFGIAPTKFATKFPQTAFAYVRNYGPSFGDHGDLTLRGHDGHFGESHTINFPWSYVDPTGKGNIVFTGNERFSVKNMEVFLRK